MLSVKETKREEAYHEKPVTFPWSVMPIRREPAVQKRKPFFGNMIFCTRELS